MINKIAKKIERKNKNINTEMSYSWRTYEGEKNKREIHISSECSSESLNMSWYACADLPDEVVLTYAVEKTNDREKTGIRFADRRLSTKTRSGKDCSGEVTHWVAKASEI